MRPPQEAPPPRPDPPAAAGGLPDVRPPEKIVTTRERELHALLANRDTRPDDIIKGSIELGLLLVREHRLDEADRQFQKLEREPFDKYPVAARTANMVGRLGQAVALAYRDQKEAAERSLDLFLRVLTEPPGKFGKLLDKDRGYQVVANVLIRYPDLAQAVADAVNRNAVTLGKTKLGPPALELLRSPPRVGKKE
jgi:serine/threonine-protein kinase